MRQNQHSRRSMIGGIDLIQLLQTIRLLSAAERMQQFLLHRKERFCKRHFVDVRVEQAAGSRV